LKTNRLDKKPVQALSALHESASLRAVTGSALRPGGFVLTERGLSLCRFRPGARIVDVGCGTGASVAYLRETCRHRALGFDPSMDLFRESGSGETIPVAMARAEALPLRDGSCDGVLCECALSLVSEPIQALGEFSRVLRNGGYLILSDIYDRARDDGLSSGPTTSDRSASGLRTRPGIEALLEGSGFILLSWEDHTRYLKELAAQLILSSESLTDLTDMCSLFNVECAGAQDSRPALPGYYLLVARKMTKGETFHG
jgi:SAM-dependent methyltransferase